MEVKFPHLLRYGIGGAMLVLSSQLSAQTALFISSSKNVYIKSTTLSANGHVTNNGTISGTTTGILNLNGTSLQNLDGAAANTTTVGRIDINNTSGVSLGTNIDVTGVTGLDFTLGALTLNASTIRFPLGSSWASNTSAKFFVTNGTGLVYAAKAAAATTYPVGPADGSANYTPITITNSGTSDSYGVRAQFGFRTDYNSLDGSAAGAAVNADVVGITWVLNEVVSGGSTLTITPQWNTGNELTGFARTASVLGYFNYGSLTWTKGVMGGVTGANPYTKTLAVATSAIAFLPVAIGGNSSPLPIELLSFEAERNGNDVLLNWSTASETNNDYFEIERSENAITFNKVAIIKGAGNSISIKNYGLTDLSVWEIISGKIIYYRLKQVDFDGQYSYSPIRFVRFDGNDSRFRLYPNPMQEQLSILYTATDSYDVTLNIVSMLGVVVKQFKMPVKKGENTLLLDLNELVNASYNLLLITPNSVVVRKIIVSK